MCCCFAISTPEQNFCREREVILSCSLLFITSPNTNCQLSIIFIFPIVKFHCAEDAPHPSLGIIYIGRAGCHAEHLICKLPQENECLLLFCFHFDSCSQVLVFLGGMNKWTLKQAKDRQTDLSHDIFKNVFFQQLQLLHSH